MAFDAEAIRADFPILARQVNGKPLVYLDSAASAQKPYAVIRAMTHAMEHSYANVHRGLHTLANETTDAYEGARNKVAAFINAAATEIVFTKGATEAVNLVAAGLGARLQAGDEIVISQMEHHANIVPWHFLREKLGVVLKWVPVTDDGRLDVAAYQDLLGPRTKVVALSHMSNVLGTVNDAKALARMAHDAGALVLFDGCQAIVHQPVDVQDLGCDFYVFSGHKLYGPTGIGVLYAKADIQRAMPPFLGGGDMIASVGLHHSIWAEPPAKFEAGTPAIIEAIGLHAAIRYVEAIGMAAIEAHERALVDHAMAVLPGIEGLRILGAAQDRGGVFAFALDNAHSHDLSTLLDRAGIAVRAGRHCAEPLHERLGAESGTCRASFGLYTTAAEIDYLAEALVSARRFFA